MPLKVLSLRTLDDLDSGKISEALDLHLRRASNDCNDRPGDGKPRKVVMEFAIIPVLADDGTCTEVKAQVQIKSTVPAHRTKVLSLGLKANGSLIFNPDSLDSVDQGTLLTEEDD